MKRYFFICIILFFGAISEARLWTDVHGKTVEAEVVWVDEDHHVKLRTTDGKIQIVPFSTFIVADEKYLENLLFVKIHGEPDPVPWQDMNRIFGLDIWKDVYLWDDLTESVAGRMQLAKESKTDFMENYRAYPLGKAEILGEPVYTIVLYGGEKYAESLCFVFLNQGDVLVPEQVDDEFLKKMAEDIEESGMHVHDTLVPVLGEPKRDRIGKGLLREKVWRWDWNGHAILLSMQEGKYAMLRILPVDRADRSGKVDKIKSRELRKRMKSCVEQRENGDVIIRNIPMIDQGPKGYCSPATWERYMRYLGIPADMYQLANIANTDIGGGTCTDEMVDATEGFLSYNGRHVEEIDDPLGIKTISKYIDQGLPVMWSYLTTRTFQFETNRNTARRNGQEIKTQKKPDINSGCIGHICLIIGYNEKTSEIAISDSWGPKFNERWFPVRLLDDLEPSHMYIIKW